MVKQPPPSELARLSCLCDQALRAVDFDPERYQPATDKMPHVLADLQHTTGKFAEIRRRLDLGFYGEQEITEKILDKLADDLLRRRRETK